MKTKDIILEILNEIVPACKSITENTLLIDELGFSSIEIIELMVKLEDRFHCVFIEEDLNVEFFNSINNICSLLKQKGIE